MIDRLDPVLAWAAVAFAVLACVSALALFVDASPILGVHPALKPMKFGVSIAIFLATLAVLVPTLTISPVAARALAWTLVVTMVVEAIAIVVQAIRGTPSHFNETTALDRGLWHAMFVAIAVATLAMIGVATIATLRPLVGRTPIETWAWRAGLWMFQLVVVSGAAMGGRGRHTIGGNDGDPGLPIVNWSTRHGDLRIPHFLAMHALQILPLIARATSNWIVTMVTIVLYVVITMWSLVRALAGLTPW